MRITRSKNLYKTRVPGMELLERLEFPEERNVPCMLMR